MTFRLVLIAPEAAIKCESNYTRAFFSYGKPSMSSHPSPDTTRSGTRPPPTYGSLLSLSAGRPWAMVFGGVRRERIQLNEDTLYAGGPNDSTNPGGSRRVPEGCGTSLSFKGAFLTNRAMPPTSQPKPPFSLDCQGKCQIRLWEICFWKCTMSPGLYLPGIVANKQ